MTAPDPVPTATVRLDARSLRGLAHPLRVRLLGLLREHGPATASGLARTVGESSGVTSYHLRQLEAHGFVVDDDTPRGSRRERWWKAAHRMTVLEPLPDADQETTLLADEYLRAIAAAYADRVVRFADGLGDLRDTLGTAWADVADLSDWWLELTPEQAGEIGRDIAALLARYRAVEAGRPAEPGTERVVVQLQVMPTAVRPRPEDAS
jgi:DNA-binding transcriptional ArsR family regulator